MALANQEAHASTMSNRDGNILLGLVKEGSGVGPTS